MPVELSDREQPIIDAAARVAREVVAPDAAAWERNRRMPRAALKAAAAAGLTGLLVPQARGGSGISFTAMARVMEELAAADLAFAFSLVVHNNLMSAIANGGSDQQRERYLPTMATGEAIGSFLLTEPQGGSDAAALATSARRDGDTWIIDGAKAWITNAAAADVLSVYAQTDPAQGWRGIACFLIDADTPGVVREPAYDMLGGHAMGTGGFRFKGCRVDNAQMLVAAGDGFKAALAGIDVARANVAAMCCGMLRSGLDVAFAMSPAARHSAGRWVISRASSGNSPMWRPICTPPG